MGGGTGRRAQATHAELRAVQRRVEAAEHALALQGIYLAGTALNATCATVSLVNPSRPNIAYVERRFGPHACVEREPDGPVQSCPGYVGREVPAGSVAVPNLRDLGLYEAEQRVVREHLTYAVSCLGAREREPRRPASTSPDALVRVVAQCPRSGERVPAGTSVALEARITLPGGFPYRVGVLDVYNAGTRRPCGDGRNPT